MKVTKEYDVSEKQLLDLLKETLPYLRFCVGGYDVERTLTRVKNVLRDSEYEHSNRTCDCCKHDKDCTICGFYA
jgi:hypothetical protein